MSNLIKRKRIFETDSSGSSGGLPPLTGALNGLNIDGANVILGGNPLDRNTTLDLSTFDFKIQTGNLTQKGVIYTDNSNVIKFFTNGTSNQVFSMNNAGNGYVWSNPVTLGTYQVVPNIAARDALGTLPDGSIVLVQSVPPLTNVSYIQIGGFWYEINVQLSLESLTDVTITSPQIGDTLSYNGSVWVNTKPYVNAVEEFTGITGFVLTSANNYVNNNTIKIYKNGLLLQSTQYSINDLGVGNGMEFTFQYYLYEDKITIEGNLIQ